MRPLFLLIALWLVLIALPAQAHLPVQLFQGAEIHEGGIIRGLPPTLDLKSQRRMPNGLYQIPPEFEVDVELTSGPHRGERVKAPHILFGNPSADVLPSVGLHVIVGESRLANGKMLYKILDYDRRPTLIASTIVSVLLLVLVGGFAGLRAVLYAGGGLALLYTVILPILISGGEPSGVGLVSGLALVFAGTWMTLGRGLGARAALAGAGAGALALLATLALTFGWGHVSGLATPDALVLYSQVSDVQTLDYPAIWRVGAMLTALGGLLVMSVITARAIDREPSASPWTTGLREGKIFLPPLVVGTGLLYFGMSLPLLLITHLGRVTSIRISSVRFMNYDYLVSVILAWQGGLVGLLVAWIGTCAAAVWLQRRKLES